VPTCRHQKSAYNVHSLSSIFSSATAVLNILLTRQKQD
jgi:hypothetical protein